MINITYYNTLVIEHVSGFRGWIRYLTGRNRQINIVIYCIIVIINKNICFNYVGYFFSKLLCNSKCTYFYGKTYLDTYWMLSFLLIRYILYKNLFAFSLLVWIFTDRMYNFYNSKMNKYLITINFCFIYNWKQLLYKKNDND